MRVKLQGNVARGLGIWPETIIARICKTERDKLPADLSTIISVQLRIGVLGGADQYVDVYAWNIVDAKEASWGSLTPTAAGQPVEWDLYLEDGRSILGGDRGGVLFDGVVNPLDPTGAIIAPVVTCSELVTRCIEEIGGLTYREGLPLPTAISDSLDEFDPPSEILWRGADAPTELQRLMEWTRHAFAFNRDGSYSIVKLVDPPDAPTPPDITVAPLPSAPIVIKPDTPGRCIITSAPTRNLIERNRTLTDGGGGDVPLRFVGLDTDGSIDQLTSLSWWPSGKTAQQVFRNNYADVAEEHRALAESSIYRMFRLHEDDLAQGWTLVSRLLDAAGDDPAEFLLKSSAARQDRFGTWTNPASKGVETGASFDLRQAVISSSRPLVRVTDPTKSVHAVASELATSQLDFTFCHLPNSGDESDYFNAVYYVDITGDVVEDTLPDALEDSLAAGAPVYRFPDLQVQYRETPGTPGPVTEVNLDEIKAIALKYAESILTAQNATIEVREYPGLHEVDPDGSVTRVVWSASQLRTVVHLGTHAQISSDYLQRLIGSRMSRGGGIGVARGGGSAVGVARGALAPAFAGAAGPTSGVREGVKQSRAVTPPALRIQPEWFNAKITGATASGTNRWAYPFVEVYKSNTGFGASAWSNVSGGITGTAGNRFELINDGTGGNYLGIGITNNELNDTGSEPPCALELRPVPVGMIVQMWPETVRKADGTVVVEYLFTWANGVYEASA